MLKLGSTDINKAYLGSTEINKIYLGADEVFSGGVVPPVQPLRGAVTFNRSYNGVEAQTGRDGQVSRWGLVIAFDCSELVVDNNAWYIANTSEGNLGNSYTITEQAIEGYGTFAPVYYSGSRTKVINSGDSEIQSDPIPASAFGISNFSAGDIIWIRSNVQVATAGTDRLPLCPQILGQISGNQVTWYSKALTTVSPTDATGVYTFTGGNTTNRNFGVRPMIMGIPLDDSQEISVWGCGDSIMELKNDNTSGLSSDLLYHGLAFLQRSSRSTSNDDLISVMNMSKDSSRISGIGPKGRGYVKYARIAVDEYLTNDVGSLTFSQMQAAELTLWSNLKTINPDVKIVKSGLICNTTSTDNWATTVNQTYKSGWEPGGKVDEMLTWFPTKVSDGTLAAYVDPTALRDPSEPLKWAVNGSANYPTNDGTHPSPDFHEAWAIALRPVLRGF